MTASPASPASTAGPARLIQPLPDGPLDIVGDVHGEIDALRALLAHLGYDEAGRHPQGRTLVFVGDLCDRGPDSPAVLDWAQRLIESGRARAILGNHEINLLRDDPKDGAGWYFDVRAQRDEAKYAPFARIAPAQRDRVRDFLATLPVALERADLRVVHAAWLPELIDAVRNLPQQPLRDIYDERETLADRRAEETGLKQRLAAERAQWPWSLEDRDRAPPFLHAEAEHESNKRMLNPLRVMTSGVERKGNQPFYAGGKWRFVDRAAWWDSYDEATPVVVGHYWRRLQPTEVTELDKDNTNLFEAIAPLAWHGLRHNVFCIDYSVGGRWVERRNGQPLGGLFKLAALRWPERELVFDDGSRVPTEGFETADSPPA